MGDVSHVVVNLERLLECAEQMLAAPESRAALATPETEENTRMQVYVERMRGLLVLAEDGKLCPEPQLAMLRRHVSQFQSFVTPAATSSIKLALLDTSFSSVQKDRHVAAKAFGGAVKRKDAREQLLSTPVRKQRWDDITRSDGETDQLLEYHQAQQEALLQQMDADSMLMRDAAHSISDTLGADRSRFAELATLNDQNRSNLNGETTRIRAQIGRTCGVTWLAILVLLVALIVFVWTIMMMRMFRK